MPSLDWNKKCWPRKLVEYEGVGHWGDHWGPISDFASRYVQGYARGTVLEIGPGAGRLTKYLLDVEQLILVDLSRVFLQHCLERFADAKPLIICYETTGFKLPFLKPDIVDLAVAVGVFMHLNRRPFQGYLRELSRVVKPGGKIVFDYWSIDAPDRKKWFEYYDMKIIASWIEAAGFKIIYNGEKMFTDARVLIGKRSCRQIGKAATFRK